MKYRLIETNETLPLVERVFWNRGVYPHQIRRYLNVREEDQHDPCLLANMEAGAKLLYKHIYKNNRVGVLIDVDADGYTSAALLINYLNKLFPSWVNNKLIYYFHSDKQHGLSDCVDEVIKSEVQLVVVPDAGGGDKEYTDKLLEHGIETLIIDHHHTTLEACGRAVVINNQLNDYPNPTLSGVGVVYKFCLYFDKLLCQHYAEYFKDLVAVGCIADLMPLTDYETLYYIRTGLQNINNPFLAEICKAQQYLIEKHGFLDPYAVGFYIAPLINATIRVGTMEEKQLLFEAMLETKGREEIPSTKRGHKGEMETRAEQAVRVCSSVKSRQTKIRDTNLQLIEDLMKERDLFKNKIVAVKLDGYDINRNILGLIANILMSKYQRPILLLNRVTDSETGEVSWAGSARNYAHSEITDLRNFLELLPEVEYATGHASAFGISIKDKDFNSFIERTNKMLEGMEFTPTYDVDFIFEDGDFDSSIIYEIDEMKPLWGQQFEEPWIAVKDIKITPANIQLLSQDKNPTIKITLPNGVVLMKFKATPAEFEKLCFPGRVSYIDIVGTCAVNTYMGNSTPQILIEEYNITSQLYDF